MYVHCNCVVFYGFQLLWPQFDLSCRYPKKLIQTYSVFPNLVRTPSLPLPLPLSSPSCFPSLYLSPSPLPLFLPPPLSLPLSLSLSESSNIILWSISDIYKRFRVNIYTQCSTVVQVWHKYRMTKQIILHTYEHREAKIERNIMVSTGPYTVGTSDGNNGHIPNLLL